MSDRIELDPELEAFTISGELLHEICRHALDVAPEECCGLVFGNEAMPMRQNVRITNVMNKKHVEDPDAFPHNALHAYYMSEVEYQRALEEGEKRGDFVSAVYHSHVGQGCYLSPDDLAFAVHPLFPFPDASQIVVSILGRRIEGIGIFDRKADDSNQFVGRRLEAS